MTDEKILYFLAVLFILLTILDLIIYKTCIFERPLEVLPIILSHRLVWIFGNFGWVFNNKKILIAFLIFQITLMFHWRVNGGCIMTQVQNEICGYPKDTNYDYIYVMLGKKKAGIVKSLYFIIIYIFIGYKLSN